jgi:carbonic anhydrase
MMVDIIKDILLNGNFRYRLKILKELEKVDIEGKIPKYPVLILTCMDPRIDVHRIFQLEPGDVFVLRNAGNLFTPDTLRSILLAVYQYNINYIIILGHLDCGMTKLKLLELRKNVPYEFFPPRPREGVDLFSEVKGLFKPFMDELKNITQQLAYVKRLCVHRKELFITGMLYDVETGWVFEYEMFKKFDNVENFRKQFCTILDEKKFQFVDFIESIEEELIENNEVKEKNNEFFQLEKSNGDEIFYAEPIEEETTSIESENLKNKKYDLFTTQTILPKIQFPKIHFPRVKIYMPKISRNKK